MCRRAPSGFHVRSWCPPVPCDFPCQEASRESGPGPQQIQRGQPARHEGTATERVHPVGHTARPDPRQIPSGGQSTQGGAKHKAQPDPRSQDPHSLRPFVSGTRVGHAGRGDRDVARRHPAHQTSNDKQCKRARQEPENVRQPGAEQCDQQCEGAPLGLTKSPRSERTQIT